MKKLYFTLLIITILLIPSVSQACQGMCGDTNADGKVNVSDAVYLINYTFGGGPPPQPVLACGDVNTDAKVSTSDTVYIISFVFGGGHPPGGCSPGYYSSDCCPFVPNSK